MKYLIIIFLSVLLIIAGYLRYTKKQINISENIEKSEYSKPYKSPISIEYLRSLTIDSDKITIEKLLNENPKYKSFLASYYSEGEKIYAQLTVPKTPKPEKGYPVIIFNHGYIPPKSYNTFYNYSAYVDFLARNEFIILKIDMRGHGNSEGEASGTYFSSTYLKDVISAKKAIQKYEEADPNNIGLWGHSMSGNLVLRSMLVDNDFKAGVIWAGAVYSYEDFYDYQITDSSYQSHLQTYPSTDINPNRENSSEIQKFRNRKEKPDFNSDFWKSISLTENINYLNSPLQIHHAVNDGVVNIAYSRDLVEVLKKNNKDFEYFEYPGGGHNITGIYFNQSMSRTIEFFRKNFK